MKSEIYNKYITIIREDADGNFNVSFPELPGCYTCGSTYEESVRNASEALSLWLETVKDISKSNTMPLMHMPIITFTTPQFA